MKPQVITLEEPLKRGDNKEVKSIEIRKPNSGALRGLNLTEILQMNTDAIIKLTPRVSEPPLLQNELESLDPVDLLKIGTALAGFLLPKTV